MGYSTRILGALEITPPLTAEQVARVLARKETWIEGTLD